MSNVLTDHRVIKWRLAAVMADREVDNQELARLTGLHLVTVSRLKSRRAMPDRLDAHTLDKLCTALDCQPGELLRFVADELNPQEKVL